MATLLEKYQQRLNIADKIYKKTHNDSLSTNQKLMIATCLNNVHKYMKESFTGAQGTQLSDVGAYSKFCMTLTNVALPSLIANELVMVKPMDSMTGYITYMSYRYSTSKGKVTAGQEVNSPFKYSGVDSQYTSRNITESKTAITSGEVTAKKLERTLAWGPLVPGYVEVIVGSTSIHDKGDGKLYTGLTVVYNTVDSNGNVVPVSYTGTGVEVGTIDYDTRKITLGDGSADVPAWFVATATITSNYIYNNEIVPQNDLPTITAVQDAIAVTAKTRRIAIYYNQLAQFQAKTDYGVDLASQLAEQAVGILTAEIDTEVTDTLIDNAELKQSLTFNKTIPSASVGAITKIQHYTDFLEIIELAKKEIYDVTKKFVPNFMIIASDVLPIISFLPNFKASVGGQINGPYFAGTIDTLKVFVVPRTDFAGHFVVGVNGNDLMSSPAVYAPYMPIIPQGEVTYADGLTSKGWATMYDIKMLNPLLLVKGTITAE